MWIYAPAIKRCVQNRKISKSNRFIITMRMIHRSIHMTLHWYVYELRRIQVSSVDFLFLLVPLACIHFSFLLKGFVSPLCLPVGEYAQADQNLGGKMGIIAGWGASQSQLRSTSASASLQWLRLPITDTNKCADTYARFSANSRSPIIITENQLCVQGRTNQDACQGMFIFVSRNLERYLIFVSWLNTIRWQRWTTDEWQQRKRTIHTGWASFIRTENVWCL